MPLQVEATRLMIATRLLDPVLAPLLLLIFAGVTAKIREVPMDPPGTGETTRGIVDEVRRGRRGAAV